MEPSLSTLQKHKSATLLTSVAIEVTAFLLLLSSAIPSNSLTLWTNVLRVGMDMCACCLALWVTRRVATANPNQFNYGLGKMENLAALFNAVAMLIALWVLGWSTIQRILHPEALTGTRAGLGVLVITTMPNIWFVFRFWWLRQRDPSPVLLSQFLLYRNALAASAFALFAVGMGGMWQGGGGAARYLDPLGSLVLCGLMLHSMIHLFRRSLSELMDQAVDESLQLVILRELTRHFNEYVQLQEVRTRRAGAKVFLEIFLEFEPELKLGEVLSRCARLEASLRGVVAHSDIRVIPCGVVASS